MTAPLRVDLRHFSFSTLSAPPTSTVLRMRAQAELGAVEASRTGGHCRRDFDRFWSNFTCQRCGPLACGVGERNQVDCGRNPMGFRAQLVWRRSPAGPQSFSNRISTGFRSQSVGITALVPAPLAAAISVAIRSFLAAIRLEIGRGPTGNYFWPDYDRKRPNFTSLASLAADASEAIFGRH